MEVHGLCTWCDRLEWCRRVFLDRRIALSLHSPKMQRVPEVLQLSVVVERAGPPSFESQPSQEFNFVSGHLAAEQGILKEFSEPGFVLLREPRFLFNEFESLRGPRDESVVQHKPNAETREVDVPGFEQRVQERNAAFG